MDLEQRDRLSELVEELTTSGEPQLSQDKMKEVKKICKVSNDYIEHAYRSLMSQLNQEHAEIRLSAFQITTELFSRSHHFRTLLVDNFQEFLELTVETDSDQPLPPPKEVAKKLKSLAVQTVQSWQASYGSAYKKLALGYHFLKQVKKVDFHDVEARTLAERRREEERQQKMQRIYGERVEKVAKEMEESRQEIEETLTEMDTCMKLLLADSFDPSDLQVTNGSPQPRQTPDNNQRSPSTSDTSERRSISPNTKRDEGNSPDRRNSGDNSKKGKKVEKGGEKYTTVEGKEEEERRMDGAMQTQEVASEMSFIRSSGLMSHGYSLDINLQSEIHVKETEDNEAVVSTVIDLHRLITAKHLPAVQSWVQVLTKSGLEQQMLRQALDLKKCLEAALQKHKELHIEYKKRRRRVMNASAVEGDDEDDEEDDDDDFEEVPEKEGFEPHIPEHLREEYGLEPRPSTSTAPATKRKPARPPSSSSSTDSAIHRKLKRALEEEQDPTRAAATLHLLRQRLPQEAGPSNTSQKVRGACCPPSAASSSRQDVPNAPVVPFGLDLFYWGSDQPSAGKIVKSAAQHQFWVPCEEEGQEVVNEELEAESRSRFISFPGRFTPVGHYCHAPLPNGTLCQRQDRLKCPFHGVIIPRDAQGRPIRAEDRANEEKRKREEQPDWRDPELMRDIEAATGEDLGSDKVFGRGKGQGKGKGKKKKYPNLSDLKQSANTSRSRLEKKVFNKSSMRRVTAVMNKIDSRKHDKFSNQFNYALK